VITPVGLCAAPAAAERGGHSSALSLVVQLELDPKPVTPTGRRGHGAERADRFPALADGATEVGVDADVVRTIVEGHKTTAYYRDGTTYVVEFTCLPDTVDPRGVKRK
jgi:hypothetical protein